MQQSFSNFVFSSAMIFRWHIKSVLDGHRAYVMLPVSRAWGRHCLIHPLETPWFDTKAGAGRVEPGPKAHRLKERDHDAGKNWEAMPW